MLWGRLRITSVLTQPTRNDGHLSVGQRSLQPQCFAGRRHGDRDLSNSTYPPLDVLKPVAADLWIVDSGPLKVLGMPLPLRMTVIRLGNGDIWIHSPTRYDEALHRAIATLGPIRHLVAPNVAH